MSTSLKVDEIVLRNSSDYGCLLTDDPVCHLLSSALIGFILTPLPCGSMETEAAEHTCLILAHGAEVQWRKHFNLSTFQYSLSFTVNIIYMLSGWEMCPFHE